MAQNTNTLQGKTIAFLVANEGVEQVELTEPWRAVEQAGGRPQLIAPDADKKVQAFNHLDKADTFAVDVAVADARVADYDGLMLPGGVANPDQLRTIPEAVQFVKGFFDARKPVAVICHGPWTLVEADVVAGHLRQHAVHPVLPDGGGRDRRRRRRLGHPVREHPPGGARLGRRRPVARAGRLPRGGHQRVLPDRRAVAHGGPPRLAGGPGLPA